MIAFRGQRKVGPRPDWSPLGVSFKISDEHLHPFHTRSPIQDTNTQSKLTPIVNKNASCSINALLRCSVCIRGRSLINAPFLIDMPNDSYYKFPGISRKEQDHSMHCLIIKGNLHFALTVLLSLLSLLLFLLEYPARPRYKREYLCEHLVGLAGLQWNPTG